MRTCMYNEDGARIFEEGEDIPKGYVDCPTKVKASKKEEPKEEKKTAKKKADEK